MHSQMFALFEFIEAEGHRVGMENTYKSVKFVKACYTHPKKFLVRDVIRNGGGGGGVPDAVKQEDVKNNKPQAQVIGTFKGYFFEGDSDFQIIVVSCVYDAKPMNFISTSIESITCIEKENLVLSKEKQKLVPLKFLRFNKSNS